MEKSPTRVRAKYRTDKSDLTFHRVDRSCLDRIDPRIHRARLGVGIDPDASMFASP